MTWSTVRPAVNSRVEANPQPASSARNWRIGFWIVGIGAAFLAFQRAWPELVEALGRLDDAHRGYLAFAAGIEMAALATLPMTFRSAVTGVGGTLSYRSALEGALGAFALSRVVPAGGLAGAAYASRRFSQHGNSIAVAASGVGAAGAVTMATLAVIVLGGVGLEAVAGRGSTRLGLAIVACMAVAAVGVVALNSQLDRTRIARIAGWFERFSRRPIDPDSLTDQIESIMAALRDPRRLLGVAGWACVGWILQLVALAATFAAFGARPSIGALILGFGAANLVTAIPHTPGGLGVVEVSMTATFVALGVPTSVAIVGVLGYRLICHWLPVVLALPLVLPRLRPGGAAS